MKIIRQGDILLIKVAEAEAVDLSAARLVVGNGEVTGHQHVILEAIPLTGDDLAWQLFADTGEWQGDGVPKLAVLVDTEIVHQEHDTLPIAAGIYEVRRQREYEPQRVRYVID